MTDAPKTVPTETKETGTPAEANKPAVSGPMAPSDSKPAVEQAAPKK